MKFQGQNLEYYVGELSIPKAYTNLGANVYNQNKKNVGKFGLTLVSYEAAKINLVINTKKDQVGNVGMVNALDKEL